MNRTTLFGLVATLSATALLTSSTLSAQTRPAKVPPAPAPVAKPAPISKPAPAAPYDAYELFDKLNTLNALNARTDDLARIKAEALADYPRQQIELARVQARDMAASASAFADLQAVRSLDAMKYAQLDAMPFAASASASVYGAFSGYRTEAPEPWAQQDPADSLYRDARKALSTDQYEKAASLFQQIWRRYPSSTYTPDAYYWQAFALQRQGGDKNLGEALASLETQQQKFPKAATRGDANSLRNRIEGQLGRRGDAAVASTLRGRAERAASDGCPRADEDERIEALNALTQMDSEKALPILKQVLSRREPCTQQLRRTAIMLIARNRQPEVAQTLMSAAKSDPDREVREQAVFWMANLPGDEAVDMLIDLARSGDDLELRKRAVYSLSRSKSPKAASTVRALVLDENQPEELRGEALMWVTSRSSGMDAAQSFSYLKELYGKTGTIAFRQRVLSLMSQQRTDDTRNFLVSVALNERDPIDLRRSAVSYVSSSGRWAMRSTYTMNNAVRVVTTGQGASVAPAPASAGGGQQASSEAEKQTQASAVSALNTIYEKAADLDIKRQALSSLANTGEAGIDRLIDVAKNEKNAELRRSAVSYLSRTKDPRALQLLQDIVNK